MTKKKKIWISIDLLLACILIFIDQYTKQLATLYLKEQPSFILLDGVLEFKYLENRGAAFGMLQNQKYFFIFVTFLVVIIIGYLIFKLPDAKKYNWLHLCFVGIISGAIGNNLFDRVTLNYVIDFIYFKLINFPIFNVADIYVCISTFFLCILLLFIYKEDDLYFISFKEKKYRKMNE